MIPLVHADASPEAAVNAAAADGDGDTYNEMLDTHMKELLTEHIDAESAVEQIRAALVLVPLSTTVHHHHHTN